MSQHWIVEGKVSSRWPLYTRSNIGEVFPEVLTPLTYHLAVKPAEAGWREAFAEMGILNKRDFQDEEPVIIGCFGGYGYLSISYLRLVGVRAPGSSPEAIDLSLFGEGNPPPYQAQKGDKSVVNGVKTLRYVLKALKVSGEPDHVADSRQLVAKWKAERPALDAPDKELMAYLLRYPAKIQQAFHNHMITTFTLSIVTGILNDGAVAADSPELITDLTAAVGDVASAAYSQALYEVAKIAQKSPEVLAALDEGVSGVGERLTEIAEAKEFNQAFAEFIDEYGHRGPNDWEISSRTWENTPELAYAALNVMRKSDTDLGIASRVSDADAKRDSAAAQIRPHLKLLDKGNFDKALASVKVWSRAREATRDLCIQLHLPTRQVFFELARRGAERGGVENLRDVAMLDAKTELAEYLEDPTAFADILAERVALRDRFASVEPPFFINGQDEVPGIEELEQASAVAKDSQSAESPADKVLNGDAGSGGVARGRARVVMDPSDPAKMEPGDVLVAPLTDPSWTPLFLPAAAVVVNVGALMSHAVIVSRELGIPCAIAVQGATDRIPDGAMVEVDGTTGTVTILD